MTLLALRHNAAHPIFRVELEQAAFNHGFRKGNGVADGWFYFASDEGVPGEVALARGVRDDGSPWFLSVEHAGVAAKLREEPPGAVVEPPPGHLLAPEAARPLPLDPQRRRQLVWHRRHFGFE